MLAQEAKLLDRWQELTGETVEASIGAPTMLALGNMGETLEARRQIRESPNGKHL